LQIDRKGGRQKKGADMTYRVTHLTRVTFFLALAALVASTTAMAGKPEAKQFAEYLSGLLSSQPTPAESGRAEAKQLAAYLSGIVSPDSTSAESGRAEAKAFADFLRGTIGPSQPTPAQSGRAEAKAFAGSMRLATAQPRVTPYELSGFDWGDAGIGAAVMLAVVLLAGLGVGLVTSHHGHRRQVPSG
jgi:hypothetical protein